MFRGSGLSFQSDPVALKVAKKAVEMGLDVKLPDPCRMFFYLPYEHSELMSDQDESVRLIAANMPNSKEVNDYAVRHRVVIERFGRFPHRNEMVGRESTSEEIEFLASPQAPF
eukprot:GHVN01099963.1.p1 GENE.GHVN01099963.1~~GHVN01099963.1.p1  ORF type:complete len:113 (-),score=25.36 GHVN01099963.1:125-463(-)